MVKDFIEYLNSIYQSARNSFGFPVVKAVEQNKYAAKPEEGSKKVSSKADKNMVFVGQRSFVDEHPYLFASTARAVTTPFFQLFENQRALKRGYDFSVRKLPPTYLDIFRTYGFSNVFKTGIGFQIIKGGVRELYRAPIFANYWRDSDRTWKDLLVTSALVGIGDAFANCSLDALSLTQLEMMAKTGAAVPAYRVFGHVSPMTIILLVKKNFVVSSSYSFLFFGAALTGGAEFDKLMPDTMTIGLRMPAKALALGAFASLALPIDNFRQEITGPNRKLYNGPMDAFTTLCRTKGRHFFFAGAVPFFLQNLITSGVMLSVLEVQSKPNER